MAADVDDDFDFGLGHNGLELERGSCSVVEGSLSEVVVGSKKVGRVDSRSSFHLSASTLTSASPDFTQYSDEQRNGIEGRGTTAYPFFLSALPLTPLVKEPITQTLELKAAAASDSG